MRGSPAGAETALSSQVSAALCLLLLVFTPLSADRLFAADETRQAEPSVAGNRERQGRLLPTLRPTYWRPTSADISSVEPDQPNHTAIPAALDYLAADSALQFARTFNPALPALPNGLGAGWRHSYDVRLTAHRGHRLVYDSTGRRHLFRRSPGSQAGRYIAGNARDGTLVDTGDEYVWTLPDGWQYRFVGSYPVTITRAGNTSRLSLYYIQGRLAQVTDEQGRTLSFSYAGQQLLSVTTPESTLKFGYGADGMPDSMANGLQHRATYQYRSGQSGGGARGPGRRCEPTGQGNSHAVDDPADEQSGSVGDTGSGPSEPAGLPERPAPLAVPASGPPSCSAQNSPPPAGFLRPSPDPLVIRVDARPGSCGSYFVDFAGIDRGQAIESAFENHEHYLGLEATVNAFPIVDFIGDDEWLIVVSRDLTSTSYNDPDHPDALYATLMRDGRAVQTRFLDRLQAQGYIEVTGNGQTTRVTSADTARPILELVIQYDMATPSQRDQIRRAAAELAADYGIELRVVEIP